MCSHTWRINLDFWCARWKPAKSSRWYKSTRCIGPKPCASIRSFFVGLIDTRRCATCDNLSTHLCGSNTTWPKAKKAQAREKQMRNAKPKPLQNLKSAGMSSSRRRQPNTSATPSVGNVDQYPQTGQLGAAHRDHRHPTPPRQASCRPSSVTSLSVRPVTFLSVIYSAVSHTRPSGKSLENQPVR
jgi:hypothetical protein